MAKRFIDPDLYKRQLRGCDPKLRLAFYWLWENSDAAGIWAIDLDLFKFELGYALKVEDLLKACPWVRRLSNGSLFMVDFVPTNYGELKPGYNPHKPVFRSLEANGVEPLGLQFQDLTKACPSLEEEGEGKEEDTQEGKERAHEPEIIPAGVSKELFDALKAWEQYRVERKSKLTPSGKKALIKKCLDMGAARSIAAIEHSMANGWAGLFEPKNDTNTSHKNLSDDEYARQVAEAANRRFGTIRS